MRYCRNLAQFLDSLDFDILHCGHVLPYFYLKRERRKPVVFQPFGNELFTLSGRGMNAVYCKFAQPILRFCGDNADVLLAEGEWQIEEMKRYYPKSERIAVLPAGAELPSSPIVHQPYGLNRQFHFLAVNSLLPYEGMDELIYAFRAVNSTSKLTIVGCGRGETLLKRMAKGLNIEFKANIDENELKHLYFKADCFVNPSYETDMQMGVLEAMSNGVPVISNKAVWLPPSVVQYDGVTDLRDKLQWITTTSASYRAEKGEAGLKEVEQYSFTEIAKQALKIYETLL